MFCICILFYKFLCFLLDRYFERVVVVVVTFMVAKLERERERERKGRRERERFWEWWGLFVFSTQDVVPDPKQGRKLSAQKVAHPMSIFASIIITKQNKTKQKAAAKLVAKRRRTTTTSTTTTTTTSSSVLVKCMVSKQQTNFALCVELLQYVFTGVFRETCGSFRRRTERQTQTERYLRERERDLRGVFFHMFVREGDLSLEGAHHHHHHHHHHFTCGLWSAYPKGKKLGGSWTGEDMRLLAPTLQQHVCLYL